jgi:hypothetical protein
MAAQCGFAQSDIVYDCARSHEALVCSWLESCLIQKILVWQFSENGIPAAECGVHIVPYPMSHLTRGISVILQGKVLAPYIRANDDHDDALLGSRFEYKKEPLGLS